MSMPNISFSDDETEVISHNDVLPAHTDCNADSQDFIVVDARTASPTTSTSHVTQPFPTTLAQLSFAQGPRDEASRNIYKALSEIRRSTLNISNRIRSVLEDARFVEALHGHLSTRPTVSSSASVWPVVPNERSGSWPLDPVLKLSSQSSFLVPVSTTSGSSDGARQAQPVSAYFKSTDGHINQWAFSTRRLNLPLLHLLGRSSCAILVDTTRRGKTFPDALRRTVPIWTSVWNNVLFPELCAAESTRLRVGRPGREKVVLGEVQGHELAESEVSQMQARVPQFCKDLEALGLNLEEIKDQLKRPIQCVWVHAPHYDRPDDLRWTLNSIYAKVRNERSGWEAVGIDVNILVNCSASRPVKGGEGDNGKGYIQGAGDDAEAWSDGLNAKLFWQHKDEIVAATEHGEGEVEATVKRVVDEEKQNQGTDNATRIGKSNVYIGTSTGVGSDSKESNNYYDLTIDCHAALSELDIKRKLIGLGLKEGKLGSKQLRSRLSQAINTVLEAVRQNHDARVLVTCHTARDLSVGVALTILCMLCDENEGWKADLKDQEIARQRSGADKILVRRRLAWITSVKPDANPSRETLKAVTTYLMS